MGKLTWRSKVIALIGVLCLPFGLSAAISSGTSQLPQEHTDQITVRAMNVEAVVMNRDGERIPGLGKGDFRLYEDGAVSDVKAVTIGWSSATPPSAGQLIPYEFTAQLQRKKQRLALAFYDIAGDTTLASLVPIDP